MPVHHNINDIKVFKHKISITIKTLPYCDKFKPELLAEIYKIEMPLYRYKNYSRETNWSTFKGKICARVDSILTTYKVNPVIIDKIKELIVKTRL